MARHNKKRNVGLIYELLIQRLSKAVVENDTRKISAIQEIIKSRFKKGTELYKEFRLFNALVATSGITEQLAYRILNEAKTASKDHDSRQLDREKSFLIKDVNHKLNEDSFYNTKVKNYPVYASAQQLFNGWRGDDIGISEIALHESTVHSWLMRDESQDNVSSHKTPKVNDLTFRIMQEKFEQKYGASLNKNQVNILKLYCEGNNEKLIAYSSTLSAQLKRHVNKYKKTSNDTFLVEKVSRANTTITEHTFSTNAESVSRIMTLAQLLAEMKEITNVKN